ncbi:MAG: sensor histidine kinase KdpD [Oligoflexia bacterium]|nr:sensor histidine kinase KdpD [Oligoflexia bacterium]
MEINEKARRILEHVSKNERDIRKGRLKIFLGMVAGVGKTYTMLNAAHLLKKNGFNVVIGLIETHGRVETEKILEGLPILPKKEILYKNKYFKELDVDEIIRRRPEIVLVDELAHTNIPGSRHEKRYQDVLDILNEGIDVYTTLNVQHIESCAGLIQNIVGVLITETLPDSILDSAHEVVLIDLEPDQIIDRLKAGKIYSSEKIESSLENFFKKSNLVALRETVLRLLADRVNVELRDLKVVHGIPQIWKTSFRILVPILPSSDGEYLIRMTRRLSSGLNAQWIAAEIDGNNRKDGEEERHQKKNALLAKQLGAEVTSIHDSSFSEGMRRLIKEYQITHLVISRKHKILSKQLSFLAKSFPDIDIILLGPEKKQSSSLKRIWKNITVEDLWSNKHLFASLFSLVLLSIILHFFLSATEYQTAGMIFLLFLSINSLFALPLVLVLITITTGIIWNYLFIPPRYTLSIAATEDWLILIGFLSISLIVGLQTAKIRRKSKIVEAADERLGFMYFLTKNLFEVSGVQKIVQITLDRLTKHFQVKAGVILSSTQKEKILDGFVMGGLLLDEKELSVAKWVFTNGRIAGKFTDTLSLSKGMYFPINYKSTIYGVLCILPEKTSFTNDQISIFEDVARNLALVIEKELLGEKTKDLRIQEASEKIYSTLFNSISHELKTPLSAISGSASSLLEDEILERPDIVKKLSKEIIIASERMEGLIQNLLNMSRIEAGKVQLKKDFYDIHEIIGSVLSYIEQYYPEKKVDLIYVDEHLPLAYLDASLFEQAIKNIIQNACIYAPMETPIALTITRQHRFLKISIRDFGPGLSKQNPNIVFEKFYREDKKKTGGSGIGLTIVKAIIELHEGTIDAENHPEGGAIFNIKIPVYQESKES